MRHFAKRFFLKLNKLKFNEKNCKKLKIINFLSVAGNT